MRDNGHEYRGTSEDVQGRSSCLAGDGCARCLSLTRDRSRAFDPSTQGPQGESPSGVIPGRQRRLSRPPWARLWRLRAVSLACDRCRRMARGSQGASLRKGYRLRLTRSRPECVWIEPLGFKLAALEPPVGQPSFPLGIYPDDGDVLDRHGPVVAFTVAREHAVQTLFRTFDNEGRTSG